MSIERDLARSIIKHTQTPVPLTAAEGIATVTMPNVAGGWTVSVRGALAEAFTVEQEQMSQTYVDRLPAASGRRVIVLFVAQQPYILDVLGETS